MNDQLATSSILVLNCGSSSIKFALFDASRPELPRQPWWNGKVDGIGGAKPTFGATGATAAPLELDPARPYHHALAHIRDRVDVRLGGSELAAVAHRVVHGGSKYREPVRLDDQVLADLKSYVPLAPLHQPFALEAIESLQRSNPGLAQVACFDTAFHHTMPDVEKMLPLPYSAWERGLRRYGFHGLSYAYVAVALAERHGERARGRCVVAHLGSGASLCAMSDLKSVATSMG
ncbi:MAG TPA: acetate kinase, partial [Reyranella sp.]|nr:acetate kinase [Reyranella sp.]